MATQIDIELVGGQIYSVTENEMARGYAAAERTIAEADESTSWDDVTAAAHRTITAGWDDPAGLDVEVYICEGPLGRYSPQVGGYDDGSLWERFVGDQTPAEFAAEGDVASYIVETYAGMLPADRERLSEALQREIDRARATR